MQKRRIISLASESFDGVSLIHSLGAKRILTVPAFNFRFIFNALLLPVCRIWGASRELTRGPRLDKGMWRYKTAVFLPTGRNIALTKRVGC